MDAKGAAVDLGGVEWDGGLSLQEGEKNQCGLNHSLGNGAKKADAA